MKALFDTHILIDYLRGVPEAKREIEQYQTRLISAVSASEILAAAKPEEARVLSAWLDGFEVVAACSRVAQIAAQLRQQQRDLALIPAMIWASAKAHDALFITRNMTSFPPQDAGIRKPY
ncbi:MAG: PIN domain-containing protein [Alphaproteobacteria bacterium]|nr:PIN domain-containing protein [Alphaproteobacteria bacterium]